MHESISAVLLWHGFGTGKKYIHKIREVVDPPAHNQLPDILTLRRGFVQVCAQMTWDRTTCGPRLDSGTDALFEDFQDRSFQGSDRVWWSSGLQWNGWSSQPDRKKWRSPGAGGGLVGRDQFLGLVAGIPPIGDLVDMVTQEISLFYRGHFRRHGAVYTEADARRTMSR